MELLPKAIAGGLGKLYVSLPEFRDAFRKTCEAVDRLPKGIVGRARALNYPQLHNACVLGDVELVEGLLNAGISPNAYPFTENEWDEPPLVWLAMAEEMDPKKKISVASVLVRHGADPEEGDALTFAKQLGDSSFATYLESCARR
ncbi:hypothetical protein BCL79_0807 [Stenotrophomonas rhizophila]|uniref:Uncharacterized protein n=1 Tax=Stenotrophomonas rhizophila TaxID=216778 RepID=A0A498CJ01_9GAMM|nr:hypothetical protein [Stenotrophomonas rhizophila]RLK56420.1 hypothetical protein BCL79_0807 [Stenotrophomonas rhizophila]